ncbi:uncharacterized protein LOC135399900 isoform X2 [Ornithodoros turicata]|uniref:uncharacterized protein LOC135399900 isoform X2 n=1 Tax=Ornithodoros turicata TaxID=34597 RepID=UPI003139267E
MAMLNKPKIIDAEPPDRTRTESEKSPHSITPIGADITADDFGQNGTNNGMSEMGMPCIRHSDCMPGLGLSCHKATGECDCASTNPIKLDDGERMYCVSARLLQDPCSKDLECSYRTPGAKCVNFRCDCPPTYYLYDNQRCESYIPAVLSNHSVLTITIGLIMSLVVLGIILSYQRVRSSKPRDAESEAKPGMSLEDDTRYQDFLEHLRSDPAAGAGIGPAPRPFSYSTMDHAKPQIGTEVYPAAYQRNPPHCLPCRDSPRGSDCSGRRSLRRKSCPSWEKTVWEQGVLALRKVCASDSQHMVPPRDVLLIRADPQLAAASSLSPAEWSRWGRQQQTTSTGARYEFTTLEGEKNPRAGADLLFRPTSSVASDAEVVVAAMNNDCPTCPRKQSDTAQSRNRKQVINCASEAHGREGELQSEQEPAQQAGLHYCGPRVEVPSSSIAVNEMKGVGKDNSQRCHMDAGGTAPSLVTRMKEALEKRIETLNRKQGHPLSQFRSKNGKCVTDKTDVTNDTTEQPQGTCRPAPGSVPVRSLPSIPVRKVDEVGNAAPLQRHALCSQSTAKKASQEKEVAKNGENNVGSRSTKSCAPRSDVPKKAISFAPCGKAEGLAQSPRGKVNPVPLGTSKHVTISLGHEAQQGTREASLHKVRLRPSLRSRSPPPEPQPRKPTMGKDVSEGERQAGSRPRTYASEEGVIESAKTGSLQKPPETLWQELVRADLKLPLDSRTAANFIGPAIHRNAQDFDIEFPFSSLSHSVHSSSSIVLPSLLKKQNNKQSAFLEKNNLQSPLPPALSSNPCKGQSLLDELITAAQSKLAPIPPGAPHGTSRSVYAPIAEQDLHTDEDEPAPRRLNQGGRPAGPVRFTCSELSARSPRRITSELREGDKVDEAARRHSDTSMVVPDEASQEERGPSPTVQSGTPRIEPSGPFELPTKTLQMARVWEQRHVASSTTSGEPKSSPHPIKFQDVTLRNMEWRRLRNAIGFEYEPGEQQSTGQTTTMMMMETCNRSSAKSGQWGKLPREFKSAKLISGSAANARREEVEYPRNSTTVSRSCGAQSRTSGLRGVTFHGSASTSNTSRSRYASGSCARSSVSERRHRPHRAYLTTKNRLKQGSVGYPHYRSSDQLWPWAIRTKSNASVATCRSGLLDPIRLRKTRSAIPKRKNVSLRHWKSGLVTTVRDAS